MDMTVIGMISGTSHDAVDAAAADLSIDGDTVVLRPWGLHSALIPDPLRARIAASLPPRSTTVEEICKLDTELGQLFGSVASEARRALTDGRADLVVSHGQTVYHWVHGARALGTLQLGAPAWIAEATGCPVVSDLRTRDITRGGHGAPLASTLDALLLLPPGHARGALNLGGIANITVRTEDGTVIAYDIGPANALMDGVLADRTGGQERMDANGTRAARGSVLPHLLNRFLEDPYYRLVPPKSTGRETFHSSYVRDVLAGEKPALDDLIATLCELTARLVAEACTTHQLDEVVVAGGGVRNPVLMARIAKLAPQTSVRRVEDLGLPAQGKEAYLFAVLGYLSIHGAAGTIPSATGATQSSILGSLTPGERPLRLPPPVDSTPVRLRIEAT